mmetsp:Transcript_2063/g.7484  ORF Transcript_2063/g.7484 Transcript_2063/m.7484 type:complete len:86 (+) Transcript_2063:135-392(+)
MRVSRLRDDEPNDGESALLEFVLVQGRKRQIRRCLKQVGLETLDLFRVAVGKLELGELPEGKWRTVGSEELQGAKAEDPAGWANH